MIYITMTIKKLSYEDFTSYIITKRSNTSNDIPNAYYALFYVILEEVSLKRERRIKKKKTTVVNYKNDNKNNTPKEVMFVFCYWLIFIFKGHLKN